MKNPTKEDFENKISENLYMETGHGLIAGKDDAAAACYELAKQMAISFAQFQGRYYADIHNPVKTDEELFKMWQSNSL